MPNIGIPGLILILVVALLVFGPSKLPQLGRAVGRTLREFKEGTRELLREDDADDEGERERASRSAAQPSGSHLDAKGEAQARSASETGAAPAPASTASATSTTPAGTNAPQPGATGAASRPKDDKRLPE